MSIFDRLRPGSRIASAWTALRDWLGGAHDPRAGGTDAERAWRVARLADEVDDLARRSAAAAAAIRRHESRAGAHPAPAAVVASPAAAWAGACPRQVATAKAVVMEAGIDADAALAEPR